MFVCLFFCLSVCLFGDRVSLCSPDCLGTHSVDQTSLELRDLPASAFNVCTTTPWPEDDTEEQNVCDGEEEGPIPETFSW